MVAFKRFNRFRKGKGKKVVKKAKVQRPPRMSFAKRVNQIIARNQENKITITDSINSQVSQIIRVYNVLGDQFAYNAFVWNPGSTIFNMSQGVNVQQRIGNKIKVKRWIIKGLVEPNPTFNIAPVNNVMSPTSTATGIALNSFIGYVDIYFGKEMLNLDGVHSGLADFYQSGATAITPTYVAAEKLYKINSAYYKIYYHRRMKMGALTAVNNTPLSDPTFSQANGFASSRSFGFDVTKYIMKNKVLTFDEADLEPQNPDIQNLTLWAIFHPLVGDMTGTPTNPSSQQPVGVTQTDNNSYFNISAMSYAEYEDA